MIIERWHRGTHQCMESIDTEARPQYLVMITGFNMIAATNKVPINYDGDVKAVEQALERGEVIFSEKFYFRKKIT